MNGLSYGENLAGLRTLEPLWGSLRGRRPDYKRWERSKAMELGQMDIVGNVHLADGREAKIVTGVDDHSRFCVSAYVVPWATARPTCDAWPWPCAPTVCPRQSSRTTARSSLAALGPAPARHNISDGLTAPRKFRGSGGAVAPSLFRLRLYAERVPRSRSAR